MYTNRTPMVSWMTQDDMECHFSMHIVVKCLTFKQLHFVNGGLRYGGYIVKLSRTLRVLGKKGASINVIPITCVFFMSRELYTI